MNNVLMKIAMTLTVIAVLGTVIGIMTAVANSAGTTVTCNGHGRQITFTPPTKGKCIWILHLKLCYPT